jgi:DNA-directed RNA polymerase subunit RPC12/RpoP
MSDLYDDTGDMDVCGETYDHRLDLIAESDGWRTYVCRECGAEILEDPDSDEDTDA